MRDTFHKGLDRLRADVTAMAELARGMLVDGVDSLVRLDKTKAEEVLSRKERLAKMDDDIEDEALHLVARQQPMARDMREIAAALKLITYINRVGRYGKDIAQTTTQWPNTGHVQRLVQIPLMADTVVRQLDVVLNAYKAGVKPDLEAVTRLEETLDGMRWTAFRECLTYMAEKPSNIEPCSHYMLIARYLERCGDNICKMAEKTHYLATGERIEIK